MKITSISYQAVKNLGNYESERLEASANVEDGSDPVEEVKNLRRFVHYQLLDPPNWMIEKKREAIPDEADEDPLFESTSDF